MAVYDLASSYATEATQARQGPSAACVSCRACLFPISRPLAARRWGACFLPVIWQAVCDKMACASQGPLICDIRYPTTAPGFVYDPTGSIERNAYKSGKEVRPAALPFAAAIESCPSISE